MQEKLGVSALADFEPATCAAVIRLVDITGFA
jgi:hypothetical protein